MRSHLSTGCIGVDLNVGFVSLSETDRFGNVIDAFNIPLRLADTSSHQAQTAIAQCVNEIVGYGVQAGKPVAVERLDFAKKKAQLSYASSRRQRMLSAFAYSAFERLLCAHGIHVHGIRNGSYVVTAFVAHCPIENAPRTNTLDAIARPSAAFSRPRLATALETM